MKYVIIALITIFLTLEIYTLNHKTNNLRDSTEYLYCADNLQNNHVVYSGDYSKNQSIDYRLISKRSIGYPLIVIFCLKQLLLIKLTQFFVVLLSWLVGLFIIKRFTISRKPFIIYSILFISTLSINIFSHYIMADLWLTVLVGIIILCLYHKSIWWAGVSWGFALMIKPAILPSVIIALFLIPFYYKKFRFASFSFSIPLIVALVTCYYNHVQTGVFQYSSISTINLAYYNAKLTVHNSFGKDSANNFIEGNIYATPNTKNDYINYHKNLKHKSFGFISENILSYIRVHTIGMVKCFVDPGRFELYTFLGNEDGSESLTELMFSGDYKSITEKIKDNKLGVIILIISLVLGFIKLLGLAMNLKNFKSHFLLYLVVIYFVGLAGPIGASRFLMPAIIPFLILTSFGICFLLNLFQKGSKG